MKRCVGSKGVMSTIGVRPLGYSERLRPSQGLCRFCIKYRYYLVPIGVFILVQLVLALTLLFLSLEDKDEGFGSVKWTVSSQTANPKIQSDGQSLMPSEIPTDLDLSRLGFFPECNISSKDAISAIHRAKTQTCKKQLSSTACKIVDGTLYVKRLERKCYNNVTAYGKHIGCYKDDKKQRILPDSYFLFKDSNSAQKCVDLCLQSGFQYAGVQYGVECFCGNVHPSAGLQLSATECNMKCPEPFIPSENIRIQHEFCGGYFSMNVFETGVFLGRKGSSSVIGLEGFSKSVELTVQPVKVVFFLTLNGRSARQVRRLIKALFHKRHYFYVHVDSRQDYLHRELLSLLDTLPNNIKFMEERLGTIWGGSSLLTILLNGMKDITLNAKKWDWKWDYVINLSESDFPLKTTKQLEYFLSVNNGKNFLKSHGRDVQKFIQKQGLDKTFDECEYRMWRMGERKLPSGILIDGGSDWIALHRDFVKYAVESSDELVSGLKAVFKYTLLPAESFFHTLLKNSEQCETFVDNNLHVTNWRRKLGCKCQYRNVVDWCGCSPNDFRLTDWNRLQLTEPRLLFFGRKFEAIINQGIINQLEGWLYPERFETNYSSLDRFWLSLYHHQDKSPKPDDAVVTLGRSLSRIGSIKFLNKCFPALFNEGFPSQTNLTSQISTDLIEITAYNHNDKLEGILVKFQTSLLENTGEKLSINVEAWVTGESQVEVAASNSRTEKFQSKLKNLKVGSDYEQKEQVFRNFAGAIGLYSEPTLSFSVETADPFNISVAWINPKNVMESATNVTVTDGTTANFVKPSLKAPLMPGNWTVKVYTIHRDLLFRVKFLVIPLEIHLGEDALLSDDQLVDRGFSTHRLLSSSQQLQEKIDNLVSKHFAFQDFCIEKRINHATLSRFKSKEDGLSAEMYNSLETLETSLCSHTQWSSFYPDPKSTIVGIDYKTGLLLP